MSDETTLLPCPFCGGEAYVHEHYSFHGYERKGTYPNYEPIGYAVGCMTFDCRGKRENTGFMYSTEAEAIAAWNARATLGSEPPYDALLRCLENDWHVSASWDGLRKFWCIELTEDGVRLRDATHGTLTAEQVREAIFNGSSYASYDGAKYYADGINMQAIADELNARAERTCEPRWTLQGKTQTQEFWRCECGNCGHEFGVEDRSSFPFKMTIDKVEIPNFCQNCGARVGA